TRRDGLERRVSTRTSRPGNAPPPPGAYRTTPTVGSESPGPLSSTVTVVTPSEILNCAPACAALTQTASVNASIARIRIQLELLFAIWRFPFLRDLLDRVSSKGRADVKSQGRATLQATCGRKDPGRGHVVKASDMERPGTGRRRPREGRRMGRRRRSEERRVGKEWGRSGRR